MSTGVVYWQRYLVVTDIWLVPRETAARLGARSMYTIHQLTVSFYSKPRV